MIVPPGKRQLNTAIDEKIYKALKIAAVERDESMTGLLEDCIINELNLDVDRPEPKRRRKRG